MAYDENGNWIYDPLELEPGTDPGPPAAPKPAPAPPVSPPYNRGDVWNIQAKIDPNFNPRDALIGADTSKWEARLKASGGSLYDPSDLAGVQRQVSYAQNAGIDPDVFLRQAEAQYAKRRGSNQPTGQPSGSSAPSAGSGGGSSSSSSSGGTSSAPSYESELVQQMMDRQAAQDAENKSRGDSLYNMLLEQAQQGLKVDRNDPVIRAQADAFAANNERAARNHISDTAERGGPLANIEGERRMASEHTGQANASFEANLMGQEVAAKRREIQNALAGLGGQLTAAQQNELQRQLGLLDQAYKSQQIGLGKDTLAQEWQRALLSNEQFNNQLGQNSQQYRAYYDWLWGHGA